MYRNPTGEIVLTNHAQTRAQQRGIRHEAILAARRFGRPYHAKDGKIAYHLGRNEVLTARHRGHRIDGFANVAILVANDDPSNEVVITVEHAPAPPKHWRLARLGGGR